MPSSRTAKQAARRGIHRTNVELPVKLWQDLRSALKLRAELLKQQHGVEVTPTFTSWLKTKAEETIAAFK